MAVSWSPNNLLVGFSLQHLKTKNNLNYTCSSFVTHLAQILRWSESGGFASVFGLLWYFWFFLFFLQDFFLLFFRHFLALLSLSSSSLLSLERPIIGTASSLPSFISSLVWIFIAKWHDSFFGDGTLWRTSIWKSSRVFLRTVPTIVSAHTFCAPCKTLFKRALGLTLTQLTTLLIKAKFSYCDQIKFNEAILEPGTPKIA